MAVNLIIVRHGNTFGPEEPPRRIGARTDLPLVESGREQARALGRRFATEGMLFARILCSPLNRARDTAALIVGEHPAAHLIEPHEWLNEIDHGPDEGMLEIAVRDRIGGEALAAWEEQGIAPPGWIVDADTRLAAWQNLMAARHDGNVLLVTSNGAARFALLAVGLSAPSLKLRTGAWGRIALGAGGPRLVEWDMRP
jgi:probable phosphoglycerate mutase